MIKLKNILWNKKFRKILSFGFLLCKVDENVMYRDCGSINVVVLWYRRNVCVNYLINNMYLVNFI